MHYNFDSVQDWINAGMPVNSYVLGDCMEGMAAMPDGFANLAIVDVNYGIGEDGASNHSRNKPFGSKNNRNGRPVIDAKRYIPKSWDREPPPKEYFVKLFKVSSNQIIFGANHFISRWAKDSPCWIVWDKDNGESDFADCELAWTSFETAVRKFKYRWNGMLQENMKQKEQRIHPTQKPIALYRWLLKNYAHPNDLIVDTHVGSASSLIACEQMGFSYVGFEKDIDYYRDSVARMIKARELLKQNDLFVFPKPNGHLAETMKLFEE